MAQIELSALLKSEGEVSSLCFPCMKHNPFPRVCSFGIGTKSWGTGYHMQLGRGGLRRYMLVRKWRNLTEHHVLGSKWDMV